ncbi:phosphoenolpyruvate--protein phosphotransferase [Reinekea blandensis]|uniref:phosphoenolpyruvate--protein phosphotransferase n=1 Tax=Reinekea blandensis MED297 TaxID=314283 RepID=A4BFD6_9GAMM|nr:phosphoenolpyruvate--protein phosphotransferase [Reinekea blandensis]EAR09249.1 multiphosphoryl transfer protein [Reinekea sp. MED297] [Reinekea blandensis MED297]
MSFFKKLVRGSGADEQKAPQNPQTQPVKPTQNKPTQQKPAAAPAASTLSLEPKQILLKQSLASKTEVLTLISDTMQTLGFVTGDYTKALADREAKVSTYLVNGVAIPHGTNEAKSQVKKTGLVIVQVPAGVTWNDQGDQAHFIVGIAANGDEHLGVLQQLTQVVMDEAKAKHLGSNANVQDIVQALNTNLAAGQTEEDFSNAAEALVIDEAGLHARPASLISEKASEFKDCQIRIRCKTVSANAKSMASLLTLGAQKGDTLVVSAEGNQAAKAIEALVAMINAGLDSEDDTESNNYTPLTTLPALTGVKAAQALTGKAASPGIALALQYRLTEKQVDVSREAGNIDEEKQRLTDALAEAATQLDELKARLQNKAPKEAAIIQAQKQLLQDEMILERTQELIGHRNSAAWSFREAIQDQIDSLSQVEDERLKARIVDLQDACQRVLAILSGEQTQQGYPEKPFILLARDLTPSQTAGLDSVPIKAICTELGGPNSHMAILARALGIPALVGLGDGALAALENGTPAIVDAQGATLYSAPDAAGIQAAKAAIGQWQEMRKAEDAQKHEPAQTRDGHHVEVVCNIANPEDSAKILGQGGEGVGLLRTEFLFEAAPKEPSVEEQMASLKAIVNELGDRQIVVRTSDIGGDKPVQWMNMPHEDNPFLGIRGLRLSMQHEDVFRRQLEAIYRVAAWQVKEQGSTGLHIMFPMIAKLSEWQWARDIAELVRKGLNAPELPLGIMIEVPSAVLIADHFAREVDFFSVGSNDLTQYTLAMDRLHPQLGKEADNYHPAILKMIEATVKAADAHGKWVGVCGNMAADPNVAALLVGLGVKELSVSPSNVAAVKNIIRAVSYDKLKIKAQKALEMGSSEAVMALYRNHDDLV